MSRPHRRHRRSRERGRQEDSDSPESSARDATLLRDLDESMLDDEERAYREATRVADEKMKLWGKAARLGIIALPVAILISPFIGLLILFFGGMGIARRFYRTYYEPQLRERFVDAEVGKRIQRTVQRERQSLEGEHSRSLEKLSASIAHEIRNPITAAKSLVQQMAEHPRDEDNEEYAAVALRELERVEKSISHLLRFAREEEMRASEISLADVLDSALETFRERAAREGVEVERSFDVEGRIQGDAEQLRRVMINLIANAMDALVENEIEKPRIRVAMGENLAGSNVWVRISDNGIGIAPELLEKIFNPFYTSKEHGTGLGLPITKRIVEAHGGNVEVDPGPGTGAEFVLTFPKQSNGNGPYGAPANGEGGAS